MNVMKLFNVREGNKTRGALGVEIEVEGTNLPRDTKLWGGEYDGSLLGNSREYVLRTPLSLLGVYNAIKEIGKAFKDGESVINDSVRAGVHVHVNMQDSTKNELFNFIVLYAIFEDVLLKRCGKFRKGNLFCLPLSSSDNVWGMMMKAAGDSRYLGEFDNDNYRYCALNVVSLHKYGSLEFRAMRTPKAMGGVYQWAKLLLSMKKFSAKYDNPMQIINTLDSLGVNNFYDEVFGEFTGYLGEQKGLRKRTQDGVMVAKAIAYSSDWKEQEVVAEPLKEAVPKPALRGAWAGLLLEDDLED
jgi:hypothetical protein